MLPNFAIIGAHKAASTFLMHRLAAHPDIFMPDREIPYFEHPDFHVKSVAWFESRFQLAEGRRAIGFKRPNLLGRPECPQHLAAVIPKARLIVTLRDPVDRAISAYFHLMKSGLIPVRPIEEGLGEILNGSLDAQWPMAGSVVEWGLYHRNVQRYLQHFPIQQFCILTYEDVQSDRQGTLRRVYEFLGVDPNRELGPVPENPMPGVYSMRRQRILRCLQPVRLTLSNDRGRVYHAFGPIGSALRRVVHGVDVYVLARLFKAPRPRLSPRLHARLAERFRGDVSALEQLLGRDLSHWMRVR